MICKILADIACKHLLNHPECHNLLTTECHSFGKAQTLITQDDIRVCVALDKSTQTIVGISDFKRALGTRPTLMSTREASPLQYSRPQEQMGTPFLPWHSTSVLADWESSEQMPILFLNSPRNILQTTAHLDLKICHLKSLRKPISAALKTTNSCITFLECEWPSHSATKTQ